MCLVICAASFFELPTLPWNEQQPAFHVAELEASAGARERFRRPHVYELGSHQRCACGFALNGDDQGPDAAESYRDTRALADFLADARRRGPIEVWVCWDDGRSPPLDGDRGTLTAGEAADPVFWAQLRYRVMANATFVFDFESPE